MKTWVLITTILLSTPEKDFSGVVIHEFDNEIACDIELKKQQNVNVLFSDIFEVKVDSCLLYTSPSPRDRTRSRMPSSA